MTLDEKIAKLVRDTCIVCGHSRRPHNGRIIGPHPFKADPALAIIDELKAENERLRKFANYVMANSFDGCDTDGGSAQDEAERLGLLELRPIPEEDSIHGEKEHYFLKWAEKEAT